MALFAPYRLSRFNEQHIFKQRFCEPWLLQETVKQFYTQTVHKHPNTHMHINYNIYIFIPHIKERCVWGWAWECIYIYSIYCIYTVYICTHTYTHAYTPTHIFLLSDRWWTPLHTLYVCVWAAGGVLDWKKEWQEDGRMEDGGVCACVCALVLAVPYQATA